MSRVLLLAGTTEATRLAEALADDHDVISSLAGATRAPAPRPGRLRTGGFGGAAGLADYLRHQQVEAAIDATHPFAAVMPHNAAAAAAVAGVPLCRVLRPPWRPGPGDRWVEVADLTAAAEALEALGAQRVLLSVGRQSTGPFASVDAWFLVRAIEPPTVLPARHEVLLDRGPFALDGERRLLRDHAVDAVVTKNAGGAATAAKLTAARELGLPVVVVARPPQPEVTTVGEVAQALAWLARVVGPGSPASSPYQRGV